MAVFAATDVFLFYIVFEATLIPAYFLIGGFGREGRSRAAVKFLIYQLAGGLIMLASVIGFYVVSARAGTPTYLVSDLAALDIDPITQRYLFLGFFIAFAIKAPMFPVHTWLADTTEKATTGTSVLLVCILDKIGTYGMLRFCLELLPDASQWATPVVVVLALISIVYGALVAIGQDDMLRLIGLTSLSHFGLIVLGIFVLTEQGGSGAILYMVNHGIATAALFLIAGFLDPAPRHHPDQPDGRGREGHAGAGRDVPGRRPRGVRPARPLAVRLGDAGHHLGLRLRLVGRRRLGDGDRAGRDLRPVDVPAHDDRPDLPGVEPVVAGDLDRREVGVVAPLLLALVLFGFYPMPLLDVINPTVDSTLAEVGVTPDGAHRPDHRGGGQLMEFTKPAVEYAQLWPLFLVFGAACLGIVAGGVPPARHPLPRPDRAGGGRRWSPRSSAPSWSAATCTSLGDGVARGNLAMEGTLALDGPTVFLWGVILVFALGGVLLFAERRLEGGVSAFAGQAAALPGTEAERQASTSGLDHTEVFPLMMFAVLGMMLFPASNDLLTMFVALEVLSLPLYLLCGLARRRRLLSQEAALKYFLLGAFSSGFFLYGIALVYGFAGTMEFGAINEAVRNDLGNRTLLLVGMGMLAVGPVLQDRRRAVPGLDARRLPGRPDRGDRVHGGRHQGGRVRRAAAAVLRRLRGRPLDLAADDVDRRDPHHGRRARCSRSRRPTSSGCWPTPRWPTPASC